MPDYRLVDVDELQHGDTVYFCYPKVDKAMSRPYEYLNTFNDLATGKPVLLLRGDNIVHVSLADDIDFGAPSFYKRDPPA